MFGPFNIRFLMVYNSFQTIFVLSSRNEQGPPEPTAKGRQTTVFRIWLGNDLPGPKFVYSDVYTRIYKIA